MAEEFNPDEYLAETEEQFDPDEYLKEEESTLKQFARSATETLPLVGSLTGAAVAGGPTLGAASLAGSALGAAAGKAAENYIEQTFFNEPKTTEQLVLDPAREVVFDAAGNLVGGKLIEPAMKYIAPKMAGPVLRSAEGLAEKATGATGKQAEKFAPGAGRRLLDEGYVQFMDNPEKIAEKANVGIKRAELAIDSVLKQAEQMGAKVKVDDVISAIKQKIADLRPNPGEAKTVNHLEDIILDIESARPYSGDEISPLLSEQTKRTYNRASKNWLDPKVGLPSKTAYRSYRDATEKSVGNVSSQLLDIFKDAKIDFGFLEPIRVASEARASQLNQSPLGGLLDMTSANLGGIPAGVATATGRRFFAPRAASSLAVGLDVVGSSLKKSPQFTGRAGSEALQYILGNVLPPVETSVDKAKRLNAERAQKGM